MIEQSIESKLCGIPVCTIRSCWTSPAEKYGSQFQLTSRFKTARLRSAFREIFVLRCSRAMHAWVTVEGMGWIRTHCFDQNSQILVLKISLEKVYDSFYHREQVELLRGRIRSDWQPFTKFRWDIKIKTSDQVQPGLSLTLRHSMSRVKSTWPGKNQSTAFSILIKKLYYFFVVGGPSGTVWSLTIKHFCADCIIFLIWRKFATGCTTIR